MQIKRAINIHTRNSHLHFAMYTSIESSKYFISNLRDVNSVCVRVSSTFKSRITFKRERFFPSETKAKLRLVAELVEEFFLRFGTKLKNIKNSPNYRKVARI